MKPFFIYLNCSLFALIVNAISGNQYPPERVVKLTVHLFLNTECPVSQQYLPQLTRLHRRYKSAGVQFVAHFPLRTDSAAVVRQFQREYAIPYACIPDTTAQLAQQLRVRVTPEVVVTDSGGHVRYQGAIDNWYVDLGQHRKLATEHYLQNALDAVLDNRLVSPARTEAVGCLVEY